MKSQEQRIKDAARILSAYDASGVKQTYEEWAAKILEAADRERPSWPSDESVTAWETAELGPPSPQLDADEREGVRDSLRAALLADPIIRAAIALRDAYQRPDCFDAQIGAVVDAVKEAGL